MSILYMGAGWDVESLHWMVKQGHTSIIYVDGLPFTQGRPTANMLKSYPWCNSLNPDTQAPLGDQSFPVIFMDALYKTHIRLIDWSQTDTRYRPDPGWDNYGYENSVFIFKLEMDEGTCDVLYFTKVIEIELERWPELISKMNVITTLFICGFNPGIKIYENLPKLNKIYHRACNITIVSEPYDKLLIQPALVLSWMDHISAHFHKVSKIPNGDKFVSYLWHVIHNNPPPNFKIEEN